MSNYLGRCQHCDYVLFADGDNVTQVNAWYDIEAGGPPKNVQAFGVFGRCKHNHKVFRLERIKGEYSPNHKCDDRCLHAKGHTCRCACGGMNHGRGHLIEVTEAPVASEPISEAATVKQEKFILSLIQEREMSEEARNKAIDMLTDGLTKKQASVWIERLLALPKSA